MTDGMDETPQPARTGTLLTSPEVLDAVIALSLGDDVPADERLTVRQAARAERRPTVTWRAHGGEHYLQGLLLTSRCRLGLGAAHAVLAAGGRSVVPVPADASDATTRNALRRAARDLAMLNPALGAEVDRIVVSKRRMLYRPSGRIDVDTRNGSTVRPPAEGETAASAGV